MSRKLRWYGHSNFHFTTGRQAFVIDPFFEGNPSTNTSWMDLPECEAVLVTHDHGDHLGQALEIANDRKIPLVAMHDIIVDLVGKGLDESLAISMNIGGIVAVDGFRIMMVQAMHSSLNGTAAGFIITCPDGYCIYHSGDTGLFLDMQLFGQLHDIDLALLPIGGRFNMDAEQAAIACSFLGCDKAVPMHWGTFPILAQNTEMFEEVLAQVAPECESIEMKPGECVEL